VASRVSTQSTAYRDTSGDSVHELFIGLMTIISLVVVLFEVFVRSPQVDTILASCDTLACLVFLFDFARSFRQAPVKSAYMFGERPGRTLPRGLFDLVGSIPGLPVLRVLRIFGVARLARTVRASGSRGLAAEFLKRRHQAALYVIMLASFLVLLLGSSLIAFVEPPAPGSNIKTGGDAFWWAFVTITTVGYGDRFPVTPAGRSVGMLTMAVGIGIFGVVTSFLSTWFLSPAPTTGPSTAPSESEVPVAGHDASSRPDDDALLVELVALRADMTRLRRQFETSERG